MDEIPKSEIDLLRGGELTEWDGNSTTQWRLHYLFTVANNAMTGNDYRSLVEWARALNAVEDEIFPLLTEKEKEELKKTAIMDIPVALKDTIRKKMRDYNRKIRELVIAHGLGVRAGANRDIRRAFRG